MSGARPRPGPEDEQAWNKALVHLAEARAMDLAKTPGAAIHSAYYAMHHAARAVVLQHDGERAATKHGGVISRFGQIAKAHPTESADLTRLGKSIHRAHGERIGADYDVESSISESDAAECLARANEFIEICGQVFKFRTP